MLLDRFTVSVDVSDTLNDEELESLISRCEVVMERLMDTISSVTAPDGQFSVPGAVFIIERG